MKKDEFLSESSKPLLLSYLHKLGVVFAVVAYGVKNLLETITIARQALRYSPNNHAFPMKNYTIINLRKWEESYN